VFSTLAVPSLPDHVLDDVDVLVRIDHTAVGDLQIALQHPDGTEVILSDHRGGDHANFGTGLCGTNAVRTVFDDEAGKAIAAGEAPFAASYRPETALSVLKGKPPGGNWRLRVSDTYDVDSGTLNCWSVRTVSHLRTIACEVFNVPPTAAPLALTLREGTSTNSVLPGADGDGDTITFFTNAPPQHGTLTRLDRNTGAFTYATRPGYSGPDSFTFGTSDGFTNSAPATVTITIVSVLTNATFARPVFQSAIGFQVQVAGAPGTNYVLEATTNFVRWDQVVTNAPQASPFWLLDPQATNLPYRFYRLRR
jgi:subtilisin-like proprotein convertase family protein